MLRILRVGGYITCDSLRPSSMPARHGSARLGTALIVLRRRLQIRKALIGKSALWINPTPIAQQSL